MAVTDRKVVERSSRGLQRQASKRDSQWEGLPETGADPSTARAEVQSRRNSLKKSDTVVWESRLSEMYVRWINSRLRERREAGRVGLVRDLSLDLKSGVVLCHLLEALSGQPLRTRLNVRGTTKIHHINNLHVYFAALRDLGVKTVNVGPNDVYDGNVTCILGLMWTNICFFALRESHPRRETRDEEAALKSSLLDWAASIVRRELPADLRAAFRDGRLFAAVLKRLDPSAPDYDESASVVDNLRRNFLHAERAFDAPLLLDASDQNPLDDEKALVAYLCEFRHCVAQNPTPRRERSAVDLDDLDSPPSRRPDAEDRHDGDDDGDDETSPVVELERCSTRPAPPPRLVTRTPASIKVAVGLHRARGLFGGRSINPYCVLKYKDKEIKTHHVDRTPDPEWNHTQLLDVDYPLSDKTELIVVYLFSANTLFADSLLGKVELLLWNLLEISEEEGSALAGPSCLLKRSFLAVTPCDTNEQDFLQHTRLSGTRSVQRFNLFHDNRSLYKNAGYLGAVEISVFSMGSALNDDTLI